MWVKPGESVGTVLPLGEDYSLSPPGTYKVIVARDVSHYCDMAVAAPIFLKVEKGPAVAEIRAGPASTAATKSGPSQMPASPKDREWLLLAAMAGETHDRFCLDAVVSCREEVRRPSSRP